MPAFRYVALDPAGAVQRGTMEAADKAGVIAALQRQGKIPMRAEPMGSGGGLADLLSFELVRRTALSRAEVAAVTRELATMLGAGQTLDQALRFAAETAGSPRVAAVMGRVREKVRGGSALGPALAQEDKSFSRLYLSLIQAGEAGGQLAQTLERLAALLERQRSLSATVTSALVYPALLVVTAIASISFLLTTVLPQFVPLFKESGAQLPLLTRVLIGLGDFTGTFGPWLLLAFLLLGLAARRALKDEAFRRPVDRLALRLPVVGTLLRLILGARFSRTLGSLLLNGVPLIAALSIAKETLSNLAAADAVDKATAQARSGASLTTPLAAERIFPLRLIHLLRLGEETAQLGSMSLKAAEILEEEARLSIQRLVSLLVPAITIAMGAAVALIVGSLLSAMLSLNELAG